MWKPAHEHPDLPKCERGAPPVAVVDVIEAPQVGFEVVGAGECAQQRRRGTEHVPGPDRGVRERCQAAGVGHAVR